MLQRTLMYLNPLKIRILFKLELKLFITNWISRNNHDEGKDEEILGLNLNINAIKPCADILECMMTEEIKCATQEDDHINQLTTNMIYEWSSNQSKRPKQNYSHTGKLGTILQSKTGLH